MLDDALSLQMAERCHRIMSHSALLACSLLLAGLVLQPAHAADDFFESDAQTPSPITDLFALRASFFHATVATDLRLDPGGDPLGGTALSGTRDLGFKPSENDGLAELLALAAAAALVAPDAAQAHAATAPPLLTPHPE